MPKTGIPASVWNDTEEQTGFQIPKALSGYIAEVYEVSTGTNSKDEPYVIFKMELAHDDVENQVKYTEYFSLTEKSLGFLKRFLMGVGRADLMTEDADWEDATDTQFECTVRHTKRGDQVYANLDLNSLAAISHDIYEIPVIEEEPKKSTKKGASPRRSPRARVER